MHSSTPIERHKDAFLGLQLETHGLLRNCKPSVQDLEAPSITEDNSDVIRAYPDNTQQGNFDVVVKGTQQ